jgi:hypothetical protein
MYTPPTLMTRVAELRIQDLQAEAQLARLQTPAGRLPIRLRTVCLAARMLGVEEHVRVETPTTVTSCPGPAH